MFPHPCPVLLFWESTPAHSFRTSFLKVHRPPPERGAIPVIFGLIERVKIDPGQGKWKREDEPWNWVHKKGH